MAYVTVEKCWVCRQEYTTINGKPSFCLRCYPERAEEERKEAQREEEMEAANLLARIEELERRLALVEAREGK